jgi:hypothetical protein
MRALLGGPLLGHGLGDAGDLPVELPAVLLGVAGAVLLAALLADRRPPPERTGGRSLPRLTAVADARATRIALRTLGLAGYAIVVLPAMLGPAPASTNPAPRTFFVLFLGLLLPVSALLGPVWRAMNPFRTMAAGLSRLAGDPEQRAVRALPAGIGVWPAAVQLAVVVWTQRSAAESAGSVLALVLALTTVQLLAALRYGPAWFRHGDPFEVLADLVAAIAPIGRGDDGLLERRPPRRAHRRVRSLPGLPVLLGVGIASYLADFVIDTPLWHEWRAPVGAGGQILVDTVTLAVLAALLTVAITVVTRRTRSLLAAIVPVLVGYALAHDLGELLVEGQFAVIQLSDPLGRGWDLLGMTGRYVPAEPIPPLLAAAAVVIALVAGHVAAVRVGADGLGRRHDRRTAAALQLGLRTFLVVSVIAATWLRLTVE